MRPGLFGQGGRGRAAWARTASSLAFLGLAVFTLGGAETGADPTEEPPVGAFAGLSLTEEPVEFEGAGLAAPQTASAAEAAAPWHLPALSTWTYKDHPRVKEFERFFEGRGRAWLETSLTRSLPYQAFIRAELAAAGLPAELLALPVIESAFNPAATSRVGAAGLWQFMTNTARPLGLRMDSWIDERRDFVKSTRAAIRHLQHGYRVLKDWDLALAAYNAGLGRIQGLMRRSGATDFWDLYRRGVLPRETAAYVPQFHAVARMMSEAGRRGLPLAWDDPEWVEIEIPQPIDLRLAARQAGLDYEDLRRFNRELKHAVTPEGGYRLKVTAAQAPALRQALSAPASSLMRFHLHKIAAGHTLSELAEHFGVSVAMIQSYNPGLRPTALRIGQELLIPALKEVGPYRGRPRAASAGAGTGGPAAPGASTGAAAGSAQALTPAPGPGYLVQAGDTLWSLSRRLGTSIETLQALNGLGASTALRAGQRLIIPEGARP